MFYVLSLGHNLLHLPLLYATILTYLLTYRTVLFTNRKSHRAFLSVPKPVTLSDLERPNGRHYPLFHTILQLSSNSLKLDLYSEYPPKNAIGRPYIAVKFSLWSTHKGQMILINGCCISLHLWSSTAIKATIWQTACLSFYRVATPILDTTVRSQAV